MFLINEGGDNKVAIGKATTEGDRMIAEAAVNHGLVDGKVLSEMYQVDLAPVDRESKIDRLTAQAAMVLASEAGDEDYDKLKKLNQGRMALKEKIVQKYSNEARERAMSLIRSMELQKGQTTDVNSDNGKIGQ